MGPSTAPRDALVPREDKEAGARRRAGDELQCTWRGGSPRRPTTCRDGDGAGAWSRCGITGAGTGGLQGLKWGPGPWAGWGETQRRWAGVVRAIGVLRAIASLLSKLFVNCRCSEWLHAERAASFRQNKASGCTTVNVFVFVNEKRGRETASDREVIARA